MFVNLLIDLFFQHPEVPVIAVPTCKIEHSMTMTLVIYPVPVIAIPILIGILTPSTFFPVD